VVFRANQRAARYVSSNKMFGIANPRVPPIRRRRRPLVRPARGRHVQAACSKDQVQVWFTRLAEESERGSSITLGHAAGLFGPDDDDLWAA
jgi:hypothetical protein